MLESAAKIPDDSRATLLPKEAFWRALQDARRGASASVRHPLSIAWAAGKLTREQLGDWAVQHHYYISPVAPHLALLYSRIPDIDARRHVLENIVGEEPLADPQKRHPELLLKFALACGKTRADVELAEEQDRILPSTRAMAAWTWELTAIRPISEACAALMVGLEGQVPALYTGYVAAMRRMGFTDEELEFFLVHIEADVGHQQTGLELAARYADSVRLQQKAIAVVRATAAMRYRMLDGIYESLMGRPAAA